MIDDNLVEEGLQNTSVINRKKLKLEKQEINFYRKKIKEKQLIFSARKVLWMIFALLAALLAHTFLLNESLIELKKKNNYLSISYKDLNDAIESSQDKKTSSDLSLKKQKINQLSENITIKESMLSFNERYEQTKKLFSYQIVEDINNNVNESMVIEEIVASQSGKVIEMKGMVKNTVIATEFLKKMKVHMRYQQTNFGLLTINKMDDENSYNFSLLANESTRGFIR